MFSPIGSMLMILFRNYSNIRGRFLQKLEIFYRNKSIYFLYWSVFINFTIGVAIKYFVDIDYTPN